MTEREDHAKLADELDREADDLQRRGDRVEEDVEKTRAEWEGHKAYASIPGALPDGDAEGTARQVQPGVDREIVPGEGE